MMPGHGANPIFFNKKNQRLDVQNTHYPPLLTSDNISFLPYPLVPESGYHMCIASRFLCSNGKNKTDHKKVHKEPSIL